MNLAVLFCLNIEFSVKRSSFSRKLAAIDGLLYEIARGTKICLSTTVSRNLNSVEGGN